MEHVALHVGEEAGDVFKAAGFTVNEVLALAIDIEAAGEGDFGLMAIFRRAKLCWPNSKFHKESLLRHFLKHTIKALKRC